MVWQQRKRTTTADKLKWKVFKEVEGREVPKVKEEVEKSYNLEGRDLDKVVENWIMRLGEKGKRS